MRDPFGSRAGDLVFALMILAACIAIAAVYVAWGGTGRPVP